MTREVFLGGRVVAFLLESDKGPRYLGFIHIDNLDIANRQLTAYGLLPDSLHLVNFPNGAQIEFQYRKVGHFFKYDDQEAFIRLKNCRLTKCWIPNLIPGDPIDHRKPVEMWVVIEGDIEVANENN